MKTYRKSLKKIRKNLEKVQARLKNAKSFVITNSLSKSFDRIQKSKASDKAQGPSHISALTLTGGKDINQSRLDLAEELASTSFPDFNVNQLSQDEKYLVLYTYNLRAKAKLANDIFADYNSDLIKLDRALLYLEKNQPKGLFSGLRSLFQKQEIKERLAECLEIVEIETPKLDLATEILDNFREEEDFNYQVRQNFEEEFSGYIKDISDLFSYERDRDGDLVKLYRSKLERLDKEIKDYDRIDKSEIILEKYTSLKEARAQDDLDEMPVEILLASSDILTSTHKLGPIVSINELITLSPEELTDQTGMTMKEARIAKDEASSLAKSYIDDYYLRFDLDSLTNDEIDLLKEVYLYKELDKEIAKEAADIKNRVNKCLDYIESIRAIAINDYKTLFLTDQEREVLGKVFKDLDNSFGQLALDAVKIQSFPQVLVPTSKQVREDFRNNSADYYAVIDAVTGSSYKDQPGDLPSFVVQKVEEFELNTDDLNLTLRPYQEFGAKYALEFKRTLLGDEMGLGKTIQALAVMSHLYQEGKGHSVVVLPLSILTNWKREIAKWLGYETYVFRGSKREEALDAWLDQGGVLITNYEQTGHLVTMLEEAVEMDEENPIDLIIVDEAHKVKNPKAQRSINTYRLSEISEYALYMTGTALENKLDEMRQLINILQPTLIDRIYNGSVIMDTYDSDPEKFKKMISSVYLRRKRDDVLQELPDMDIHQQWSNFSLNEEIYYLEALKMGKGGRMKMRRAAFYEEEKLESEKIQHILDICQEAKENGHKILIFSFFKIVLNYLKDYLEDDLVGVISGDVSVADRQVMIDDLSEADPGTILLAQIDAGGMGLNIQSANVVILCEPQYKPSTENQAISRVYRMGQTKKVIVYRLLTEDSIDESMLDLLNNKQKIFDSYADDSAVAQAYFGKDLDLESMSEEEIMNRVFEYEEKRQKSRLKEMGYDSIQARIDDLDKKVKRNKKRKGVIHEGRYKKAKF